MPDAHVSINCPARRETILIIECDAHMQRILKRTFLQECYLILTATDGQTGLELFQQRNPTVVLLDLHLPGISAWELCRRIRTRDKSTAIIVISEVLRLADKISLLEIGADDYITKPFSPRELLARLRAIRRRAEGNDAGGSVIRLGDCEIDFLKMEAIRDGHGRNLSVLDSKVLRFFTENPKRIISREELLTKVWEYQEDHPTRTVDNQIFKLRQKLEQDPARPRHLKTVRGAGYMFLP